MKILACLNSDFEYYDKITKSYKITDDYESYILTFLNYYLGRNQHAR